ncbi:hypothetical protein THRCLA_08220 [Thraustotheca clavata]|uniref:Origin recognition complex subunit 4 n=1 Tax=Thraustotheca clavata TaxID=74557 RepID=A0A1V9Z887_9STRA|nr:hypothetical protein THRCLA_08220 [Thraustotheca clavata]
MSNKAAAKQSAKDLLELCKKDGVQVPTDPMNAMIQAGTMLNATREDGEFNLPAALKAMIEKFGVKKVEKSTKKRKAPENSKEKDEDDASTPKKKKVAQATNPKNQDLAEAFAELAGFEFKRGEKFKGGSYSKVAKAIRDAEDKIESGKAALKLKGIGKASAAKIDEFLENGKIEKLEEYRAGNIVGHICTWMDFAESFLSNLYEEEEKGGYESPHEENCTTKKRKLSSPVHLTFTSAPMSPIVHRSATPPSKMLKDDSLLLKKKQETFDAALQSNSKSLVNSSLSNTAKAEINVVVNTKETLSRGNANVALSHTLNKSTGQSSSMQATTSNTREKTLSTSTHGDILAKDNLKPSIVAENTTTQLDNEQIEASKNVDQPDDANDDESVRKVDDKNATDSTILNEPKSPSITLENAQLNQVKVLLKNSIAKQHATKETTLIGLDSHVAQVENLLERTVVHGENQSALLVGSHGTGKRSVIQKTIYELREKHREEHKFHTVYLGSSLFQNEIEAFREIVYQLSPNGTFGQRSIAFFNMYDFIKQLLLEKALASEAVIFILDDFDAFVSENKAKQLLMYNLLDWMQTKEVRIGLIGISANFNILSQLEKRVKSRFSSFQIVLLRQPMKQVLQLLWMTLQLRPHDWPLDSEDIPPPNYFIAYEERLHYCLFDQASPLLPELQYWYDLGKPTHVFLRLAYMAVTNLTADDPFLEFQHFQRALSQLAPPHQLQTLQGITTRELTLLLAMISLERQGRIRVSFEMVFQECSLFYRKHALKLPGRMDALKALDNLLSLQLVHHINSSSSATQQVQPEYRMLQMSLRSSVILQAIKKKEISCTTLIEQWALNSL